MKKYINCIDDVFEKTAYLAINKKWVVAKPKECYGLLKYKIRLIKAIAVLLGKADAFTYNENL